MTATLEFWAGRLFWRKIRSAIEEYRFKGYDVEYFEGTGFIERKFIIKGDNRVVQQIHDWLKEVGKP